MSPVAWDVAFVPLVVWPTDRPVVSMLGKVVWFQVAAVARLVPCTDCTVVAAVDSVVPSDERVDCTTVG